MRARDAVVLVMFGAAVLPACNLEGVHAVIVADAAVSGRVDAGAADTTVPPEGSDAGAGEAPGLPIEDGPRAVDDGGSLDAVMPGVAPDGGADAGPWCSTQQSFDLCFDFDVLKNVEAGWMSVFKLEGGKIERSPEAHSSPPAAVHFSTPASRSAPIAVLEQSIMTSRPHARLELDLRASPVTVESDVEEMRFARLGQTGEIILAIHKDGWNLIVGPPLDAKMAYSAFRLEGMPALETFKHVVLDVVWGRGTGSVRLEVGGVTVVEQDGLITGDVVASPTKVIADVGIKAFEGSYPAAETFVDNVIVRTFAQ